MVTKSMRVFSAVMQNTLLDFSNEIPVLTMSYVHAGHSWMECVTLLPLMQQKNMLCGAQARSWTIRLHCTVSRVVCEGTNTNTMY